MAGATYEDISNPTAFNIAIDCRVRVRAGAELSGGKTARQDDTHRAFNGYVEGGALAA